jgi:hypothetical protein
MELLNPLIFGAVQKCSGTRRAWFDELTMTGKAYQACPEPAEGLSVEVCSATQ